MQEDHRHGVGVLLEHGPEEGGACRKDQLVRAHGLAVGDQGHVQKVLLVPDVAEGTRDVGVEIVPAQAVLLSRGGAAAGTHSGGAHALCFWRESSNHVRLVSLLLVGWSFREGGFFQAKRRRLLPEDHLGFWEGLMKNRLEKKEGEKERGSGTWKGNFKMGASLYFG